jgi:aspartate/methionine/tyrosine aminotransferase
MNLAARMAQIEPFHVMELMARAKALEAEGRSIIHLEVGEPDFATADPILEAAQRFLSGGHVHYTAALGLRALREAISGFYRTRYGLDISPDRIVITAGASGALLLALGVLVNPADEWLMPDPGYPCNRHFVRLLEGRPVSLPVGAASNYQPTTEQLAASWTGRSKGLMLASPANPTGTLLDIGAMAELAAFVAARDGSLLVDEIYHGLTYGVEAVSALAVSDELFVINSFSKYFGMTGWRLGWLVAPQRYVREIEKLAQNLYIAPSTVAQHAALAAFQPETMAILEARRSEFSLAPGYAPARACASLGSRSQPSRKVPSMCMPTAADWPPTVSAWPGNCWPTPASRPRRASTSAAMRTAASHALRLHDRPRPD